MSKLVTAYRGWTRVGNVASPHVLCQLSSCRQPLHDPDQPSRVSICLEQRPLLTSRLSRLSQTYVYDAQATLATTGTHQDRARGSKAYVMRELWVRHYLPANHRRKKKVEDLPRSL